MLMMVAKTRAGGEETSLTRSFVGLRPIPLGEPDAANPHVRFDERGVKTGDRRSWGMASVLRPAMPFI
jgi:hypothetical protein